MIGRGQFHRAKLFLGWRPTLGDCISISEIEQRHSDFELIRNRIRESGTDDLSYFGNGYTHEGGLYLQQNPDEFAALTLLLREYGPHHTYLEIGSASGGACLFLYREVSFASTISIDDHQHARAHAQAAHFSQIPNFQQFIGDSHSGEALRFLQQRLGGNVDVAFIDGDHSYDSVWQDIQMSRSFCRPGALMILHDIVWCEDVHRAWRKCVKENLLEPIAEFVGEEKPLGLGVGRVVI